MGQHYYLGTQVADRILGAGPPVTQPGTLYAALAAASPYAIASYGRTYEPDSGGYARLPITNDTTNFPPATGTNPAVKRNGTAIAWPTATGNWTSGGSEYGVNYLMLFDAVTAGHLLWWAPLPSGIHVLAGDAPQFAAGALALSTY